VSAPPITPPCSPALIRRIDFLPEFLFTKTIPRRSRPRADPLYIHIVKERKVLYPKWYKQSRHSCRPAAAACDLETDYPARSAALIRFEPAAAEHGVHGEKRPSASCGVRAVPRSGGAVQPDCRRPPASYVLEIRAGGIGPQPHRGSRRTGHGGRGT